MAKYVYPAVFTQEAEGGYSINFPDLPNCFTSAPTLEEGLEMAADVLCLTLYGMEEDGITPPAPSDVRSIPAAKNADHAGALRHDRIPQVLRQQGREENADDSLVAEHDGRASGRELLTDAAERTEDRAAYLRAPLSR